MQGESDRCGVLVPCENYVVVTGAGRTGLLTDAGQDTLSVNRS